MASPRKIAAAQDAAGTNGTTISDCTLCPSAVDGVLSMLDMSTTSVEKSVGALSRLPEECVNNTVGSHAASVAQDLEGAKRSAARLISRLREAHPDAPEPAKDPFTEAATMCKETSQCRACDIVCDSTFEALRFSLQATLQCLSALNAVTPKALPVTAIQPLELAQYRLTYAETFVRSTKAPQTTDTPTATPVKAAAPDSAATAEQPADEKKDDAEPTDDVKPRSTDDELAALVAERQELKKKVLARQRAKYQAAEKRTLNAKELKAVKEVFDKYDTDNSGFINHKELGELAEKLGCAMGKEELEAAMKALDKDADAKISFDEFVDWWSGSQDLGGNHGAMLAVMRARLAARDYIESLSAVRKKKTPALQIDTSKRMDEYSLQIRTETVDSKSGIRINVQPSTQQDLKALMKSWNDKFVKKHETPDEVEPAVLLRFVVELNDDCKEEELKADVDALQKFVDVRLDHSEQGRFRIHYDFEKKTAEVFFESVDRSHRRDCSDLAGGLANLSGFDDLSCFDPSIVFSGAQIGFQTGLDWSSAIDTRSNEYGVIDLLDKFSLDAKAQINKDYIDIQTVEIAMGGGLRRIHRKLPQLLAGFSSGTTNVSAIVNSLPKAVAEYAGAVARRTRERLPAEKDSSDAEAFAAVEKLANGKDLELEEALNGKLRLDNEMGTFTEMVVSLMKDLRVHRMDVGNSEDEDVNLYKPIFFPMRHVKTLRSVSLMIEHFTVEIETDGVVNPFVVFPSSVEALKSMQSLMEEGDLKNVNKWSWIATNNGEGLDALKAVMLY
eukprot:PhM_4_TR17800/c0_g1_i1/m.72472